jgi:hypothetical protein
LIDTLNDPIKYTFANQTLGRLTSDIFKNSLHEVPLEIDDEAIEDTKHVRLMESQFNHRTRPLFERMVTLLEVKKVPSTQEAKKLTTFDINKSYANAMYKRNEPWYVIGLADDPIKCTIKSIDDIEEGYY